MNGVRDLAFTCSWSDFFHEGADGWRDGAWRVIRECPHVTFQILTKRVTRVIDHLPDDWGDGYPNVWLGVSVETDEYTTRADVLRKIPARVRSISAEPLLGPLPSLRLHGIDWVIIGGESGPDYRAMDLDWARQVRDLAVAAGAKLFYKQGSGPRSGMDMKLDGREWREFPDGFVWHRGRIGLPMLETVPT